jgi:hydrogenase maturation protein HypF
MAAHRAIADAALTMISFGLDVVGGNRVALSGGVFMNRILCELVARGLAAREVAVLTHGETPPNDGAICLGQLLAR